MQVRGYVNSTVLLAFHPRVRILLIGVSITCRHRECFRLWVALRLVIAIAIDKVLIRPCRVFSMGFQAIVVIQVS